MISPRVPLLLACVLVSLTGCTSRTGSGGCASGGMRDFLRRYGSFSPAEAIAIAIQIERGSRDLALQRAAARREGLLLTLHDLQAPLPPPRRNAAPVYLRMTRVLKERPLDPKIERVMASRRVRVAHSEEEIAAARRMLSQRPDVVELAHEAASKPECVFRRDWSRCLLLEFPEFATMREAARLLSAESYLLAREGRYREAIANEAHVFRIADHANSGPNAISQLVGMACDTIALIGMENVLSTAGPNAQVDEAVRTTVAAHRPHLRVRRALEGEIVLYSVTMHGVRLRATGSVPPGMAQRGRAATKRKQAARLNLVGPRRN